MKYEIPVADRLTEEYTELHHDDLCVNAFAKIMKAKLSVCRDNGYSGWETCPIEHLNSSLLDSVKKGDPVDVANYAMMIRQRGHSIETPEPKRWTWEDKKAGRLPDVGCRVDFCHKLNTNWRTGEIKYVYNQVVVIKADDIDRHFVYEFNRVEFKPIETQEERAQRLRSEWIDSSLQKIKRRNWTDAQTFSQIKEFIGDIYDAQLSGELQAPTKGE